MLTQPAIVLIENAFNERSKLKNDLERKYAHQFRILEAASGEEALDQLKQMSLQSNPVALLITDEQLTTMNGSAFLKEAQNLYPQAKRLLLITYADTHAAIQAINTGLIDYYLIKPCQPPEERLYPPLDDLLANWLIACPPSHAVIRVIDHRWSPKLHEIGSFLARFQIPYQWLDIEKNQEADYLLEQLGSNREKLPVVIFSDGSYLVNPDLSQLAEKLNLKTHPEKPFYDLTIVGSGPAGLAAAVYGASEGLHTLLVEREVPGGQAGMSSRIENYLGFPTGLSGSELTRRALAQAERFGAEIATPQEVTQIQIDGQYRSIIMKDNSVIRCHTLLLACGVSYRKLNVPGEAALIGAGVYYGASVADAMLCKNEDVYIVGGANSAGQAAVYFSRYARRIVMLVRGESLSNEMSKYLIDRIQNTGNIEVKTNTSIVTMSGTRHLESITIVNNKTHEQQVLPATSLFIFIGAEPYTCWLEGVVERDEKGFILTGSDLKQEGQRPKNWPLDREPFLLETSIPGIFTAGDVRHGSIKRVASSVGEGAMAVMFIHRYLG